MSRPLPEIYLDYQATTPVDRRVIEAMNPFFSERFGNPHSTSHGYGWDAAEAVEIARREIADLIGAEPREVIFTSGATESNNLAIKGAARFHKARGKHRIVTVATEHKCVLESCRDLVREGFEVDILPVGNGGLIDLARLDAALTDDVAVASVMMANNEIGVVQPVSEIGRLCRARGILFHTDAAQAVGKIAVDVEAIQADLISVSGHKIYAPMGIGALYVRRKPRARIEPLFSGGGQERGLRSGTLPTPLCVGLGAACRIAAQELIEEAARLKMLRDALKNRIIGALDGVTVNGVLDQRLPGNINLSFAGIGAEDLMMAVPEIALSTGSACTSAALEPSYVLRAMGVSDESAHGSIRFGLGRFTTEAEIERAAALIVAAVRRLRGDTEAAAE